MFNAILTSAFGLAPVMNQKIGKKYLSGYTQNGVLFEKYSPEDSKNSGEIFVLYTGFNVGPGNLQYKRKLLAILNSIPILEKQKTQLIEQLNESSYMGSFPYELAQASQKEVVVVYQPAVSPVRDQGFYSSKTHEDMIEASQEIARNRKIYPVTHSLSSEVAYSLLTDSRYQNGQFFPGTMTSVFTDINDALSFKQKPRRILGIKWISLYRLANWIQINLLEKVIYKKSPFLKNILSKLKWIILIPVNPLKNQKWHDYLSSLDFSLRKFPFLRWFFYQWSGFIRKFQNPINDPKWHSTLEPFVKKNPNWGLQKWVSLASVKYVLSTGLLEKTKDLRLKEKPMIIIPSKDKIFEPELQEKVAKNLGIKPITIKAGHRLFTEKGSDSVIQILISHLNRFSQNSDSLRFSSPLISRAA